METVDINTGHAGDAKNETIARAKEEALAQMAGRNAIPPGCRVDFMPTSPYAGTEPPVTPVIRRPVNADFAALPA